MVRGELRVSLTVSNADCVSPGFHVKHVDTDLSVIAEVRGYRRTLDELRRNGCGCMMRQNVGCRDNRAAGWALPGTIVKYARGPTNASRHSPSGLTWGGDRNRPLPSASRLSAGVWGQVREGAAGPQLRTLGPATMTPQRRSSLQRGVHSVDRHGSVVKVKRERRWNTTSVSRETTSRFRFAAWKRGLMPLHERRYFARRLR